MVTFQNGGPIEVEVKTLRAHITKVGVTNADLAFVEGDLFEFIAGWLEDNVPFKRQRESARRMAAHQVAGRLLRRSRPEVANNHFSRYASIRRQLAARGIPEDGLQKLTDGITRRTRAVGK